ncbi:hypothetical protein SEPCBS119000_000369 [Sporothrix epigloea]|uniref:Cation chloride cotransporter n=1 Tax=Sporothrix epigloea TaxID=1892477 RepID=A0ABP0D6E6_9PEZI
MEHPGREHGDERHKLGVVSGVYVPVCLSILSILMFLRFGSILGQIGLVGMLSLLVLSYLIDLVTALSLSAVASNGEVKGGGTYYLISRSLGPEFGGAIGLLFYLSQVLNTALNVVGLIDCLGLGLEWLVPHGYWWGYLSQTAVLVVCTLLCLAGSSLFAKASNGLLLVLAIATLSIPISALVREPFIDSVSGVKFTGLRLATLRDNLLPHSNADTPFHGLSTFRGLFGILFPATSGIFAGASMSGDLRNPSRSIPNGTLWAMGSTIALYLAVIFSLAASTTHTSLLSQPNVIMETSIWPPIILAGECAVTFFSALMGLIGASRLMQALGRDRLLPGLSFFSWGTQEHDEPFLALAVTYAIAQLALFADLNQIATFISMGYMVTFFVMNLACFLLKVGSAPNFRPAFKFFSWHTALLGSVMSAAAMFFIDAMYATSSVVLLVMLFLLIHYLCPPKRWGDVSQNLIYHQVRKYLLRLKPEHIKFWRPQIILLTNNPRRQTRLIQFCNSMKKGGLYILGHVIVTDDFSTGVVEAKLQQTLWSQYITESSRIKAFVQLTMSPSITWGVRNLILASGLGGMRPNIAVLGFYNMDELRSANSLSKVTENSLSTLLAAQSVTTNDKGASPGVASKQPLRPKRRRGDTMSRLLEGVLPTDVIKTESMMKATEYLTILEDLALQHRINVAVAKGFHSLQTPRSDGTNTRKYIDLWPIQMSAELEAGGKSVLTTNFDTYTLILQLGYILHTVPAYKRVYSLRVMVFVEYESEVNEERGRVAKLLENLRISAEIHVFWLASGNLTTYEAIVQGEADPETEKLVDSTLSDLSWWQNIQTIRGKFSSSTSANTALASLPTTSGRNEDAFRRRPSLAYLENIQKHQKVSALARLGLSMGIRAQSLAGGIPSYPHYNGKDEGVQVASFSDSSSNSENGDYDTDCDDDTSESNDSNVSDMNNEADPARQPLLAVQSSGKSSSKAAVMRPALGRKKTDGSRQGKRPVALLAIPPSLEPPLEPPLVSPPTTASSRSYGTMSATALPFIGDQSPQSGVIQSRNASLSVLQNTQSMASSSSMRFSSRIVPETRISNPEDSERTIMFAESPVDDRTNRPPFSRTNSRQSRVSLADSMTKKRSTAVKSRLSVSFAEPGDDTLETHVQRPHRPLLTRHSSTPVVQRSASFTQEIGSDVSVGIKGLVADYRARQKVGGDFDDNNSSGTGSSYSTQDLALSFNDLPSRAQHLILNELMLQQSGRDGDDEGGAAVLFTTLPVPDKGTHRDERASVQFLSDVEILCRGLPPVLMVLSNNMTVTVSL